MDIREAIIYKNIFGGGGSGSVDSVNGQTGEVVLTASDVGALPDDTPIPSLDGYATEDYVDGEINDVQSQIDAIVSRSDVVDVVGTYAELQAYDTSSLSENDVVKVLDDSTHSNQRSYYRWSNNTWVYVGSESVGYTKAETDTLLSDKENTSNKVTTISSASTNTQYPSAKAVYDFIVSLDGNGVAY